MSAPSTSHLTHAQRALLEADLKLRLDQLRRRSAEHRGGLSLAEHAHEVIDEDPHDAPQREDARALDQVMLDRDSLQMRELAQSLARVHEPSYGLCEQCGGSIPFDRLKVEPWAARCVPCQEAAERPRR